MSWIRRISIYLVLIFLLPFLISTITLSNNLIQPVSAASCSSSNREPIWGIEAANISIQDYNWWGEKEEFIDEGTEDIQDMPAQYIPQSPLGTLTQDDDFSTSQMMENDSTHHVEVRDDLAYISRIAVEPEIPTSHLDRRKSFPLGE